MEKILNNFKNIDTFIQFVNHRLVRTFNENVKIVHICGYPDDSTEISFVINNQYIDTFLFIPEYAISVKDIENEVKKLIS